MLATPIQPASTGQVLELLTGDDARVCWTIQLDASPTNTFAAQLMQVSAFQLNALRAPVCPQRC
jgi:hypothetical protein